MANFEQQLAGHRVIGLDTAIFIYHLEANYRYLPLTTIVLNGIQLGQWTGITSTVTIMELTIHPWRINRPDIAHHYEAVLANFPNLQLVDINRDVARRAAQLRANYNLRPADALQIAAALVSQATAWVSNDRKLKRLAPVMELVILDEFVSP